ncbi:MAG: hypothetical protein IJN40_03045 [Clostridia bacterium]|nr:hypothetical protein [Clostridia bacterium]
MTKKFISIFLAMMILTSMFTGVVFAETASETLTLPSSGASWLLITNNRCEADSVSTSVDRKSVVLVDLEGYEPYLYGADSISMTMQNKYGTSYIYGMEFIALPDEKEQFINSSITYSNSVSNGIYNATGNIIAFRDYDVDSTGNAIGYQGTVTVPVNKANLIAAYEDGNNSVVALKLQSRGGGPTTVKNEIKIAFNYDANTYIDVIANEFDWSDISDVASDGVTQNLNLPEKFGGCDVSWQSNSTAVNAQTGVVTQGKENQNVTLTATLSHNGKTSSKEFDIVVPAIAVSEKTLYRSYITYVRGGYAADGSYVGDKPQTIDSTRVIADSNSYYTYVCFKLDGLENIVDSLAGAEISAYAGKWGAEYAYSHNYVLLSDEGEQYIDSALSYDKAKACGIQSGGTIVAQKVVSEGYKGVQSTEITNIEALKNAIASNPTNSIIAFRIDGAAEKASVFIDNTFNLKLKYYENEVKTKGELFEAKKNTLDWSHISPQPIDEVKENLTLPSKFWGFDLSWKSDNEAVVASDGTITRGDKTKKATLTATVSYNGESVSKDFEVTVPKIAYAYGGDLYEGTKNIVNASAFVSADGVYGKKASDKVYKLSSGTNGYLTLPSAGSDGVLEFSAYVPEGSGELSFEVSIVDGSQYGAQTKFVIKNGGIYNDYTGNEKIISELTDGWHTYTYVAPKGDGIDDTCEIYIDGVKISETIVAKTTKGFRHIRVYARGAASGEVSGYMDNIRTHCDAYRPGYDTLSDISYSDGIENKNILLKSDVTVAEFKDKITADEDVSIRVYASSAMTAPLSDSEVVKAGYVVVAASKNGTEIERSYNYYTIEKVKYEAKIKTFVNGNEARIYNAGDTLRVAVDFDVYVSGASYNATMYVAQYKYGELVNLWTEPKENITNSHTFICNFENIEDMEGSSIKIMLVDDELSPYCEAETMRFNRQDTEATLFLMGDSIVQTYENFGYPIQGWGFYIDDYLNNNIKVENRATSGWTTDHYLYPEERGVIGTENEYKTWENIKSELKAGDYVMVSLGINDAGSGNVSEARYRQNIEKIYNDASIKGATVILSTPTIQGKAWGDTSIGFSDSAYAGRGVICKSIANSYNSVCLPLGSELVKTYNAMAEKYLEENPGATRAEANNYVGNYFHIYALSSTDYPEGWNSFGTLEKNDAMHYNPTGAKTVAGVIARLILESDSSLADYVVIAAQ